MNRIILLFILGFIGFYGCNTVKKGVTIPLNFTTASKDTLPYNIFYPTSYGKKGEKVPLFLWLHGAGERGNDNKAQLKNVVPYLISPDVQAKFPAVIVVPQCPKEGYWAPVKRFEWSIVNGGAVTPPMHLVIQLLDKLMLDQNIDTERVYVGGLSMGGFGTLDLLSRRPEIIAAAVPVCGGSDLEKVKNYKDVPLWIFHGAKDDVVKPELSRDLVAKLKVLGKNPRYTEYPEGNHGIWEAAVREPELLQWLFSQRKGK